MTHNFINLNLIQGEVISLMIETGEVFTGIYENDYNNSNETFQFRNFSNGQTQTIYIERLQDIQRA